MPDRLRPRKIIRDVRRKLAVGYWRHLGRVPQRLILIIATPRSGSTWLFDAVRSHPGVHVQTDPTVMALLGTQIGRRYPLDLSLEADGTNDIYINVTDKARLPDLSSATREDEPEATKMALEKGIVIKGKMAYATYQNKVQLGDSPPMMVRRTEIYLLDEGRWLLTHSHRSILQEG